MSEAERLRAEVARMTRRVECELRRPARVSRETMIAFNDLRRRVK